VCGRGSVLLSAAALAVALAANDEGVAVVCQAIEGGAGEQWIAKRIWTLQKRAVALSYLESRVGLGQPPS